MTWAPQGKGPSPALRTVRPDSLGAAGRVQKRVFVWTGLQGLPKLHLLSKAVFVGTVLSLVLRGWT